MLHSADHPPSISWRTPLPPGLMQRVRQDVKALDPQAQVMGARLLAGGVSAMITAVIIAGRGEKARVVVIRRHGPRDRARNPHIAQDEFRLLHALRAAGLPVPEPLCLLPSQDGEPSPGLVMGYISGQPDWSPLSGGEAVIPMAAALAQIHRVDWQAGGLGFLPNRAEEVARSLAHPPSTLDESLGEGAIRRALAQRWPPESPNPTALLHGDFWPGNLLWHDGELAGVVDWEDAALGDPLADLASARLELLWALGAQAMSDFTRSYAAQTGADLTSLPAWDLWAALRPAGRLASWGLSPAQETKMRLDHREFVAQALALYL